MTVAIFDLDHTLIDTDSDHAWGEFLTDRGVVDQQAFKTANDYFYRQYQQGTLDIEEYLRFSLAPLAENPKQKMESLRQEFLYERIVPRIKPGTEALLRKHRNNGDTLLVITATNHFITRPIVSYLGIEQLLAIDVEQIDGRYTGRHTGIPTFREGKVTRFRMWLEQNPGHSFEDSWFYSDSFNDLPLLELAGHPVAVDPDNRLQAIAEQHNWSIISLK